MIRCLSKQRPSEKEIEKNEGGKKAAKVSHLSACGSCPARSVDSSGRAMCNANAPATASASATCSKQQAATTRSRTNVQTAICHFRCNTWTGLVACPPWFVTNLDDAGYRVQHATTRLQHATPPYVDADPPAGSNCGRSWADFISSLFFFFFACHKFLFFLGSSLLEKRSDFTEVATATCSCPSCWPLTISNAWLMSFASSQVA